MKTDPPALRSALALLIAVVVMVVLVSAAWATPG
jgi:hypothetical protein